MSRQSFPPGVRLRMLGCQGKLEDDELPQWRAKGKAMTEILIADCHQRGLTPKKAPAVPSGAAEGFTLGPFRVLYQYSLVNVIGYDGPDDDPQPIYGPPCWLIRVDTLAESV